MMMMSQVGIIFSRAQLHKLCPYIKWRKFSWHRRWLVPELYVNIQNHTIPIQPLPVKPRSNATLLGKYSNPIYTSSLSWRLFLYHFEGFRCDLRPEICGAWWLIGRFNAFRPRGRGLASRSSRQPRRNLGQVLHSQLTVVLRRETPTQYQCSGEHLWVVVDLKRRYIHILNERMNEWNLPFHSTRWMLIPSTSD